MTNSEAFVIRADALKSAYEIYNNACDDAEAAYCAVIEHPTPPVDHKLDIYLAFIVENNRAVNAVTAELKLAKEFADDLANKAYNDLVKMADAAYKTYKGTQ